MSGEAQDVVRFCIDENSPGLLSVKKDVHNENVQAFLEEFPYDPRQHNGTRNPYTGDVIATEDDYKRYVHEHTYCRECERVVSRYYSKSYSDRYSGQISTLKDEAAEYRRQLKTAEENNEALKQEVDTLKKENHRLRSFVSPKNKLKRENECIVLYMVCFALFLALIIVFCLMCVYKQYVPEENATTQSRVEANLAKPTSTKTPTSTPKPSSTPAPQNQSSSTKSETSTTVYITNSGSKYHKANCSYLSKSKISIDLSKAKSQGYEPCSKCY